MSNPVSAWPRSAPAARADSLDVIVNSSGLTDFNPDLREALAMNVRSTVDILNFLRECDHAALLHLSTFYVVGRRDGRVLENLPRNYTRAATAISTLKRNGNRSKLSYAIPRLARSHPK